MRRRVPGHVEALVSKSVSTASSGVKVRLGIVKGTLSSGSDDEKIRDEGSRYETCLCACPCREGDSLYAVV